jgi:hypothetical protein
MSRNRRFVATAAIANSSVAHFHLAKVCVVVACTIRVTIRYSFYFVRNVRERKN